ncbi:MAG TPA: ATP-binding protein [Ktedonobacteraceae bacterium]|nr:ATP-binding protein [Ktedonobacteraceae bacterium]
MVFDQPIESITERDIQALIDEQRAEQKTVEYKRSLPGGTDADKKEFLADVSSLANTAGGHLFYGIEEQAGIPTKLPGVQLDDVDAQKLRLENILRDGIAPRLPRIDIHAVALTSNPGYYVLILRIGKSWLFPHRVIFRDHGHFYTRNSAGKYSLDVTELRTAFELSGTTAERIRNFRAERLSKIASSEELPVLLDEQAPKLVLHVIPFTAFSTLASFDLSPLYDAVKGPLLRPLVVWDLESNVKMRFNVDGIVRCNEKLNPSSTLAYTQIFRNGIIETSDISILGVNAWNAEQFGSKVDIKSFHGERYERKILETVKRYIEVEKLLNVDPPFFIMVSFLGVKGYRITDPSSDRSFPSSTDEIDRINLIIPESIIDTFDADLAEAMKPIFDTVWNAAGFTASPNYDASGKFRFGY